MKEDLTLWVCVLCGAANPDHADRDCAHGRVVYFPAPSPKLVKELEGIRTERASLRKRLAYLRIHEAREIEAGRSHVTNAITPAPRNVMFLPRVDQRRPGLAKTRGATRAPGLSA